MQPEPFSIHIADAVLEDLGSRIQRMRWPRVEAPTGITFLGGENPPPVSYARGVSPHRLAPPWSL